jgi:YbgC/YbaW family acyl-CoA thioester hydrolase
MTATPHPDADAFGFAVSTRVEIADTDLGGVVYYGNYARLLDRALMAYRRNLEIPELGPDGHLFVVRHLACDYRRSARFGDELIVRIRTARVGRSSHTIAYRIEDAATGDVVATAEQVIVGVSGYEGGRPTRVPEDLAARLQAFEADR